MVGAVGWAGVENNKYEDTDYGMRKGTQRWDDAYFASVALGWRYSDFRFEAELNYQQSKLKSVTNPVGETYNASGGHELNSTSLLVGAFYDIDAQLPFKPYVGAGVGAVYQHLNPGSYDNDGGYDPESSNILSPTGFVEIGLGYQIISKLELVPSYRYVRIFDQSPYGDTNGRENLFKIGMRYSF